MAHLPPSVRAAAAACSPRNTRSPRFRGGAPGAPSGACSPPTTSSDEEDGIVDEVQGRADAMRRDLARAQAGARGRPGMGHVATPARCSVQHVARQHVASGSERQALRHLLCSHAPAPLPFFSQGPRDRRARQLPGAARGRGGHARLHGCPHRKARRGACGRSPCGSGSACDSGACGGGRLLAPDFRG